jgi:HK97 family phage portal protein
MGWKQWLGFEAKSAADPLYELMRELGYVTESRSGLVINAKSALDVSTVLAIWRVLGEGVGQVPLKVYKPTADGRGSEPATDHPLYDLLYRQPNRWQSSFEMRETLVGHVMLNGNAFFYKNVVRGQIKELIPLGCDGDRVEVIRNRDLSLTYRVTSKQGVQKDFPQDAIWHIRGPSWNSWMGLDAVRNAREAIGLAKVTESSQADLHKNGAQTSGVYSIATPLDAGQHKQLAAWIEAHIAGNNKLKPLIVDRGATWTQTQMTGVDAQHLETRRFQIEEICRHFRVFPQMVGHSDKTATFASAEQFFLAHVVHTLMPWYTRLEQSIDNDLIGANKEGYFAKFTVQGLLRGAAKDRGEFYAKALGSGGSPAYMTPNEIRGLEDLNPIEGGDELPKPTNVAPAAKTAPGDSAE